MSGGGWRRNLSALAFVTHDGVCDSSFTRSRIARDYPLLPSSANARDPDHRDPALDRSTRRPCVALVYGGSGAAGGRVILRCPSDRRPDPVPGFHWIEGMRTPGEPRTRRSSDLPHGGPS